VPVRAEFLANWQGSTRTEWVAAHEHLIDPARLLVLNVARATSSSPTHDN
jgi:hypothetical protein